MAKTKKNKSDKKPSAAKSSSERKVLKLIGRQIQKDLIKLDRPLEWLSWEAEVSRATIRNILNAERNVGILTLSRIAKGLGHKSVFCFLKEAEKLLN